MEDILEFWFVSIEPKQWWKKDAEFDTLCLTRFGAAYEAAARGEFEDWKASPLGCVALCLLLDQVPRNAFRETPQAFATDANALAVTHHAVACGFDLDPSLDDSHRQFLYMPLQHSERIEDQHEALRLADRITRWDFAGFAKRHHDIVARFGRFPHRNAILGRESTEEERQFLTQPGSSF
ncbi:MAG: DUF924 family protein [Pseudomonadota bacterium]